MSLSHENLEVYKQAIEFVAWCQPILEKLPSKISVRDQLDRASTSLVLNLAEGNGKFSKKEKRRFFQISQGSATESSACLDILVARGFLEESQALQGKEKIEVIVRMLVGLYKHFGD